MVVPSVVPATPPAAASAQTGDYIIILGESASVAEKVRSERSRGNEVSDVFSSRVKGFVAELDAADVRRLRGDAQVLVVERDSTFAVTGVPTESSPADGPPTSSSSSSTSTSTTSTTTTTPVAPATTVTADAANDREYIVTLRTGVEVVSFAAAQADGGARVIGTVTAALNAFAAVLSKSQIARLAADPGVSLIEENAEVRVLDDQADPPSWGLDRIDQRSVTLDRTYSYDFTGAGVTAYVVDTGVRSDHLEFGGRVATGFTRISDGRGTQDCHGHGTHVAGTIGGQTYGVAKEVTIVPVRVMACDGRGSTFNIIAGLDWMITHHAAGVPAVANLSIGGSFHSGLNQAVASAVRDGITVVVAAGNNNNDASKYSPASAASAVTVGATAITDARSSFSNYGSALDLFAPGSGIVSASIVSSTASTTLSGTSMAAPHVAGAAALLLQEQPGRTPAQVFAELAAYATPDLVTDAGTGSPNLLLFTRSRWTTPLPTLPSAPRSLVASAGVNRATLTWTAPTQAGTGGVSDYVVEYSSNDGSSWTTFPDGVSTTTSAVVTGLVNGTTYSFRVSARNDAGTGPASGVVRTAVGVPSAPGGVDGTPGPSQVGLAWSVPGETGGSPITDYVVEYRADDESPWSTFADGVSTATVATVTGLTNGVAYRFRVSATNAVGTGSPSTSVTVVPWQADAPSVPRDLVVEAVMATSMVLEWRAPTTDGGSPVLSYEVDQSTNDGATWSPSVLTGREERPAGVHAATVYALESGREYRFRVRAINATGSSDASAATPPRAPGIPDAPIDVRAVEAGPRRITLRWERPSSDGGVALTRYTIDYALDDGPWTPWPGHVDVADCTCQYLATTLTDLTDGVPHVFRIRAENIVGAGPVSDPTDPMIPLTPEPPGPPRDVTATPLPALVDLEWNEPETDNGAPITDYIVEHSVNGGSTWTTVADATSTATVASVSGMSVGVAHLFRVRAVNSAGTGSPSVASSPVSVLPPLANDAFSGAIPIVCGGGCASGTTVGLASTTRTATRESGEPSHGGPGGSASIWYSFSIAQAGVVVIDTQGSSFDTLLGVYTGSVVGALNVVAVSDDASPGSTWSRVTFEPEPGTTYRVAVDGYAGATGATTLNWTFTVPPPPERPDAPRDVRAVAGDASAGVYWTAPLNDGGAPITGYTATATPGGRSCTTTGALTCAISGLVNGTDYTFAVVAVNRAGSGDVSIASSVVTPSKRPSGGIVPLSWGLDRVDQRGLPLDDRFVRTADGAGVTVYVVDTGVRPTHAEFAGRVAPGYSAIDDGNGSSDCHGHGTHTAGVIAGSNYGVAPAALIVPVRVLDCEGLGSTSEVIAGIDWLIAHHTGTTPAVANMSLGGPRSAALDMAVARGVADGITFVVAAGNSNVDACTVSPAGEPDAITVGATDSADARWSSSNFGSCVDVFAPGVAIVSAGHTNDAATRVLTGTSVASPHVAGVAASALGRNPTLTPSAVAALIVSTATKDAITNPGSGSANRLLYAMLEPYATNGDDGSGGGSGGGGSVDPDPSTNAPTAPTTLPVTTPTTPTPVSAGSGSTPRPAVPGPGVRPPRGTPSPVLPATATRARVSVRPDGRMLRITVTAPQGSLVHVYRNDRLVRTLTAPEARSFSIPAKGSSPGDVDVLVVAASGRVFVGP
jgi:subtilisin family serine protease